MNRYKKEQKRKHDEARQGCSPDQIIALDMKDAIEEKIEQLTREIHGEKFPEEYDFMYDSIAEVNDRNRGINPMRREYIEKIREKRAKLGVSPLAENGMRTSNDTYYLCEEEARKQILSDITLKRPASESCVFCNKTLDEVGGRRIVAQQLRGVSLSEKKMGGGNKDYPHRSLQLFDDCDDVYVVFWGEKELWTESAVEKVKKEYQTGYRPWFCQICGKRTCSECGAPINYPMGSDLLSAGGCSSHAPIHPFDPGCINPNCEKYKQWDDEQEG